MNNENIIIEPCEDLSKQKDLVKLELNSTEKICISALFQQIPSVIATETLANAYILKLPTGVTVSNMMQYADGGIGSTYFGEHGIAGHASFQSLQTQAMIMGAFTAMSIASGQYFLSEINSNLKEINHKADKILEFLYGDKRAELISEVSFVNSAYQNYYSIMKHNQQRMATIINLQESRKIAVKDIEFYMMDLDSLVKTKDVSDLDGFVNKTLQIKNCLQLAIHLYSMSNVLEVYYSGNTEYEYLRYVEKNILTYIDKCEKRMLSCFSAIQMSLVNFKGNLLKKIDTSAYIERIGEIVDLLGNGEEFIQRKPLQSALQKFSKETIYYIDKEGDVYLKTA